MNLSVKDPLLNIFANFIVQWVQIGVLEPQAWWNKRGCLPFQKSEVRDTDLKAVRWRIVLLADKELTTDLTHDRQLLLSQKYVIVIRVR